MIYEMLVGQTPASWPGAQDVELGRFDELPEAHRLRLDGYPGRVEQVLVKALALRPQYRYESTGELAAALTTASERTTRFSDDEVRQLLRRAAEIQAEAPAAPLDLTMGHVEQIAAQVGIPPAHVREAAKELERGPEAQPEGRALGPSRARRPSQWETGRLGGDWRRFREEWDRLVVKETVDAEVPEAAFPAMVAEINRSLGAVGHASIVGRTLTWSPATQSEETRKVVIQVSVADGRTDIRIQEELGIWGVRKLGPAVGAIFGAGFGGATGQAFAMGEPAGPLMVIIFALLGVLIGVRSIVAIDASERGPALEDLAGALAEIGRAAAPRASRSGKGT